MREVAGAAGDVSVAVPMSLRILLASALCLLAAACERNDGWYGTTTPRHGPNELWLNNGGEPEWFDPGKCSDAVGGVVINNAFEGLVAPHPKTLVPTPGMAERWELSADKRTWTFHLRAGTKWSDGTPLTADDFVWSWARVLNPKTLAKYGDQLYDIANGDAYHQRALHVQGFTGDAKALEAGVAAVFPAVTITSGGSSSAAASAPDDTPRVERVKADPLGRGFFVYLANGDDAARAKAAAAARALAPGVTADVTGPDALGLAAPDDRTFVVTLETPIPYFLIKINTQYTFYPVPRHVLDRLEAEGKSTDLWTRPENFVSNGPFVLTEHRFRHFMTFEKNPHYWDAASVSLERVKLLEIESYVTALQMYKAGEIDWIGENSSLPSEYSVFLKKKKDYRFTGFTTTYWYWFNTLDPALSDKRVRHALNLATDKQRIVDAITKQDQIPATSYIQEGLAGYKRIAGEGFDPEKGRQLLAEAGFPGGKGLPPVTISYNTSETHKAIAEGIQEMWRKELGIDAQIRNEEWKVFLKNLQQGDYQVGRLGWTADYPDPYTFLSVFMSTSGNNHSKWRDKKYDDMLEWANAADSVDERLARLAKSEEYLLDALPAMPIYFYTRAYIVKPYVKGLYNNFQDRHPWKAIHIDPDAVAKGIVEDGDGGYLDLGGARAEEAK